MKLNRLLIVIYLLMNGINWHNELETLYIPLTKEGPELLERNKDLELGRVKYLSEEEAFNV
jgi:hypothetical protein